MARKLEKPKANSIHGQTLAARENDNTVLPPPELSGCEMLNDVGRDFYESLYRSEPARWSAADLRIIVNCALVHQELHVARQVAAMTPPLFQQPNHVLTRHPQHILVADLEKRLHDGLRHLGARGRDGAKAAPATKPAPPAETKDGNVTSFEQYLKDVLK